MKIVIKIGGTLIEKSDALDLIAQQITELYAEQHHIFLIHGGGSFINQALMHKGIKPEFIQGMRKTSPEIMDIVEDVLCTKVNTLLTKHFQAFHLPVVGISGKDRGLVQVKRKSENLGLVGEITGIDLTCLALLINKIPLIASIGIDCKGTPLNVNADDCAAAVAVALKADQLIYLTEQDGVIQDNQVIDTMTIGKAKDLVSQGIISQGMIVKVNKIFEALQQGVKNVFLINPLKPNALKEAVIHRRVSGTSFQL